MATSAILRNFRLRSLTPFKSVIGNGNSPSVSPFMGQRLANSVIGNGNSSSISPFMGQRFPNLMRPFSSRPNWVSPGELQTTRKLAKFYGGISLRNKDRRRSYIPLLLNQEKRLEVILVRLHFCDTIRQARQLISHGKVCVNSSERVKKRTLSDGDVISFKENDCEKERRKFFYLNTLVDNIVGKVRESRFKRSKKQKEWLHLLKKKKGCSLLLKSRFLQRLHTTSMLDKDLERSNKFGYQKVSLGRFFAERSRLKRVFSNTVTLKLSKNPSKRKTFIPKFGSGKQEEKEEEKPIRNESRTKGSSISYKDYYRSSSLMYCSASSYNPVSMKRRNKKKIKRIALPTHYLEVNHRTMKAVVTYGPNIDHIPHGIKSKELNLLLS